MTTNQQLKAHCEDVIANPALYCIVDPDGLPYMSEICVATDPGVLEDEVAAMNDDLEDGEPKYTVKPLFLAPPLPVPELKPVKMPQRYTTRIGTYLVSGAEVTRVVMIPDEHGQWLSIYDVEHEFNRMRGIPS